MSLRSQFLLAIFEYLSERLIDVRLFSGYLEVRRRRFVFQIEVVDSLAVVGVCKVKGFVLPQEALSNRSFDLAYPGSFQCIYEFVISKDWK